MINFKTLLENSLEESGLTIEDFQTVVVRLLSHQVIYSEQSNTEREAYNLYRRLEEIIHEYLAVMGFSIYHDKASNYVVLFAPGSNTPIMETEETDEYKGLKRKLTSEDISLLLILRQAFEEAIKQSKTVDEKGNIIIPISQINQGYQTYLGKNAPTGEKRNDAYRTAVSLRLIDKSASSWDEEDGLVKVRPVITSMVYADLIKKISKALPEEISEEELLEE